MSICAFTSVCEDDAYWVGRYLTEVHRLKMPFAAHLDRCYVVTRKRFYRDPYCIGTTEQNDKKLEFNETHKQEAFDLIQKRNNKFTWAMAWDVDETYERDAPEKLKEIDGLDCDNAQVRWVNLWGDELHVRTDGPFANSWRVKFYRMDRGTHWQFYHATVNGAKALNRSKVSLLKTSLVCLHWGLMTQELREQHKARWDRIYTTAVGGNPYGMWNYALNEAEYPPTIERHSYR